MSLAFLLFLACADAPPAGDTGGADADAAPTWHQDVQPLMAAACMDCHQGGGFGGFSLTAFADVYAMRDQVAEAVAERRMPPWLAADGCTTYEGDISLSQDEIDLLVDWVEAGAPEGQPVDQPAAIQSVSVGGLSRVDHRLPMPQAYMPEGTDDYRCFVVPWPEADGGFVTGYDFEIGSTAVVHHIVAYIAPPETLDQLTALDLADGVEGDGYTCFGGPGIASQEDARWLGGWAPGGVTGDLPEGTGIYVDGGGAVVLQMHYNTERSGPALDQSTMLVRVDSSVDHPGIVQPWADPSWLSGDAMLIPAGTDDVTHSWGYPLGDDYLLWTANLHMHELGQAARLQIERTDGQTDCMLDIPRWDFHWQRSYRFAEPKPITAGDRVDISCTWDNPTDQDVVWGDATTDEMCLGTFLITLP